MREGEVEYEVESIKGHRRKEQRLEFLVGWKGYNISEDMYLPESELANCDELLNAYKIRVGIA